MADIHPFTLKAFDDEVQAQADLQRLRAEILAAEAERDRIREESRREGFEQGRREGVELAAKAERERVAGEVAALRDVIGKAAAAIAEQRAGLAASGERDLVKLALAVAAKVVKTEIQLGKPVALENLHRAVELTALRHELQVLLNAQDLARIEEYLPELRREYSEVQKISLEAAPGIEPGGVIVQTRSGSVDLTIDGQLDQIARGLLG
jgi:flagellar assembly protein FliH